MPTPSKALLQPAGGQALASTQASSQEAVLESPQKSFDKELFKKQIEEKFMPSMFILKRSGSTASPLSQGDIMLEYSQETIAEFEKMLRQNGLSDRQITKVIDLYQDYPSNLLDKFTKQLSPGQCQSLSDCMEKEKELQKKRDKTYDQLHDLLIQIIGSLEKRPCMDVTSYGSNPIFQELIQAMEEQIKINQVSELSDCTNDLYINHFDVDCFEQIQALFLQCSHEEQKALQSCLENCLSVQKCIIEQQKNFNELIPNVLVGEIQQLFDKFNNSINLRTM